MTAPSDPRAIVEYRVPAHSLTVGDLVNTQPGEGDWQEVKGVYRSAADHPNTDDLRTLVAALDGRYVAVVLTDVAAVDGGVYFHEGAALIAGDDESSDSTVSEVIGDGGAERIYLYTKYEAVNVRAR